MTTDQAGRPATGSESTDKDTTSVLDEVRRNATDLLSDMDQQPRALHLRVGDVAIDVEWPEQHQPSAVPDSPMAVPVPAVRADQRFTLSAPAVGVFYLAPEPGADPFVRPGDTVAVGQQVAIIEAMKLMIPVEAEIGGVVADVLKADGEPVEYGEPLFALADAEGGA